MAIETRGRAEQLVSSSFEAENGSFWCISARKVRKMLRNRQNSSEIKQKQLNPTKTDGNLRKPIFEA
jgi:hypothetical protein